MPERSEYAPGIPCWVDIGTDIEGAKGFYGGLFGWQAESAGPPEETGGYGFFTKDAKMVAGYGPQMNPGPPVWATYVSVADAGDTAAKVGKAGGTVVMAPMDVMGQGHMAVFQDPQGAFFSVWQPGQHHGAQLVSEPGAFAWTELNTTDVEAAKAFYRDVFGWDAQTSEGGDVAYTEFKVNGESIAGGMHMPPGVPAGVPPHWLVYFAVDDPDAAVERARGLGGTVALPPMDFPGGRFAVVMDPQGAAFGVLRLAH